jgi:Uma2 family endonuclease
VLAPPSPSETQASQPAGEPLPLTQAVWPSGLPEALHLPVALLAQLRLNPEQFAELCAFNRDAVLELEADGSLILMTPTGSETGSRNGDLFFQIKTWARGTGSWKAFDSSTGFRLPDDSVLSPDAALVALDRWQPLSPEQLRGFAPLCPDLVVELASTSGASPSDEGPRGLKALRQKRASFQRTGARLGWLLIPAERAVEIWGPLADPPRKPSRIEKASRLDGGPEIPGLVIELDEIWAD